MKKHTKTPRVRKRRPIGPNVTLVDTNSLTPCLSNARTHSPKQIGQLKSSITAFGFINPILVDSKGEVIAGHGRLLAGLELGLQKLPVISILHLSVAEVRAYRLADNKIAENATWDASLLQIELSELLDLQLGGDLSFDMNTIGFETGEVDLLIAENAAPAGEVVETPTGPIVTRVGETWRLGRHEIACGSCLEAAVARAAMGLDQAALLLTDPPYNVPVNGHVRGSGQTAHREFEMASGEMSPDAFTSFLSLSLGAALAHCAPGALAMVFMDWRHMTELNSATSELGLEQINLCVWVKTNGGMGSLYRSQHELCSIMKVPGGRHQNNIELGRHGRYRTNVWSYPGVNSFGRNRNADLIDHPTVKPLEMIEDAIRDATKHGDIVLDPFGGSGTTLIAAERCMRTARLIELDPAYVDVTIRRWQELTGEHAIEATSGETWNERATQSASGANTDAEDVPNV